MIDTYGSQSPIQILEEKTHNSGTLQHVLGEALMPGILCSIARRVLSLRCFDAFTVAA